MDIPKELIPDPILDAMLNVVVEKIDTTTYSSFIKGLIIDFPSIETEPTNVVLKNGVFLRNDEFYIVVTKEKIVMGHYKLYEGWIVFKEKIDKLFDQLSNLSIKVIKYHIQYVNFFPLGSVSKENTNIWLDSNFTGYEQVGGKTIRFVLKGNGCVHVITFAENAKIKGDKFVQKDGLIIDIQTKLDSDREFSIKENIDFLHGEEKSIFFKVVTNELLRDCTIKS